MLSVTATTADYYLPGGCGREEETGTVAGGPAEYYAAAMAAGEPPGRWMAVGVDHLGLPETLDPDEFRMVVDEHRNPWELIPDRESGGMIGAPLGRRPGGDAPLEARVKDWKRRHKGATPEDVDAARARLSVDKRPTAHAWDHTFSVPKSISAVWASLEMGGRHDEAEQVWTAIEGAVRTSLELILRDNAWVRVGAAGPEPANGGPAAQRHERVDGLTVAIFRHHTSRDQDPQLHVHAMVLGKVKSPDGKWRALDSPPLTKEKHGVDIVFLRTLEGELGRTMSLHFAARPDGVAREVLGVTPQERAALSTRTRAVNAATEALMQAFERKYGRPPAPHIVQRLRQQAVLDSRAPKVHMPREDMLAQAEARIAADIGTTLADVLERVDDTRHDEPHASLYDPVQVIEQALAHLDLKTSWQESHLRKAIGDRLPDHLMAANGAEVIELIDELAAAALASHHVVPLRGPRTLTMPASMVDGRTGESLYDAPSHRRYTTPAQFDREDSLVARLDERGGPRLDPARVDSLLAPFGLGEQQGQIARTIATSDRRMIVVDAAAGVGKSVTIGATSEVLRQETGAGIVGFTTSQNAAQVLAGEGLAQAFNIRRYLFFRDRADRGEVGQHEIDEFRIAPGSVVAIDEASTTDIVDLLELFQRLDEVHVGRYVVIGDTQQVDAVDRAGAFALLAGHADTMTIETVRRFENQWERDASVRIRSGDVAVVSEYDARGRLHGSTDPDQLRRMAVDATARDLLLGRDAIAVTVTTEEAAAVSSMIRRALVDYGHVSPDPGVALHDETAAAAGDIVQARENDWHAAEGPVINRETFRVVATGDDGHMDVQRNDGRDENGAIRWGITRSLDPEYVARFVELGYAGTVDAVQGRTVDDAHNLPDHAGRGRGYSGMTRGRLTNHAYLPLDEHETPAEAFAKLVATDDHERSAHALLAEAVDREESLGHLGVLFQSVTVERARIDHTALLREALGERADTVLQDEGYHAVLRQMRSATAAGHDARALIAEATGDGTSIDTAKYPARALHERVAAHYGTRAPEGVGPKTWAQRAPQGDTEEEALGREVGKRMDAREVELGMRMGLLGVGAPEHLTSRLGAVPEVGEPDYWTWVGNAAHAAGYRERYGWNDPTSAIGPRPTDAAPEQRWKWDLAARHLGVDPVEQDLTSASRGDLSNRVDEWTREQTWMPPHVSARLKTAHIARDELRAQYVDAGVRGDDTVALGARAQQQQRRVDQLEEIAAARTRAMTATSDTREAAVAAEMELARRAELEAADQARGLLAPEPVDEPTPAPVARPATRMPGIRSNVPAPVPEPVTAPEPVDEAPLPLDLPEPTPVVEPEPDRIEADLDRARAAMDILDAREAAQPAPEPAPEPAAVVEPVDEPVLVDEP